MLKIKLHSKLIQGLDYDELDESVKDVEQTRKAFPHKSEAIDFFTSNPISDNKYIYWMVSHLDEAPPDEMVSTIKQYDSLVKKNSLPEESMNNIHKIKNFANLKSIIESDVDNQKIILVSKNETGGRFEVIRPLNVHTACSLFGSTSKWCIAATKSTNYFKKYSRGDAVFYTIIDHSKKAKEDPTQMFTYAILRRNKNKKNIIPAMVHGEYEIFDAADQKVDREKVKETIGDELEERFYSEMKREEKHGGRESEVLESGRHFIRRMEQKIAEAIPRGTVSDISSEVREFIDDWNSEYTGKTKIISDREKAQELATKNVITFLKYISKIKDVKFKRNFSKFFSSRGWSIPGIQEIMLKIDFDPNWRERLDAEVEVLTKEEAYSGHHAEISDQIQNFAREAVKYKADEPIQKIIDFFINSDKVQPDFNNTLNRANNVFFARLIAEQYDKIYNYANALLEKFIDNKEENIYEACTSIMQLWPAGALSRWSFSIKSKIALNAFNNALMTRDDFLIERLAKSIIKLNGMSAEVFNYVLKYDKSDKKIDMFKNPNISDVDEETFQIVYKDAMKLLFETTIAQYKAGILSRTLKSKHLTKKQAKNLLDEAGTDVSKFEIVSYLRSDINSDNHLPEINANLERIGVPKVEKYYNVQGIEESRIFKFNKDYKVFKIL